MYTSFWVTLLFASFVLADEFRINGQRYHVVGPGRGQVPWQQIRNLLRGSAIANSLPSSGFLTSMSEDDIYAVLRQEIDWLTTTAWPANSSHSFENWAQTEQCSPAKTYNPTCPEDIQAAILEAKRDGKRIRAVGRGHSESPIFSDSGEYMVYTNNLRRITKFVDGPEDSWTVQLETGATTGHLHNISFMTFAGDLKAFLKEENLSIPSNVILDVVKLGGVIITGCHGTGTHELTVSDRVVELRIVDSQGVLRTYREGETPEHIMQAARVNLGLFGILYDFKMKVDPMKNVLVKDFKPNMDSVFLENNGQKLKDLARNHFGVEIMWYPFNDRLWVKQFDLTDDIPEENPSIAITQTFRDWIEMNFAVLEQRLTTEFSRITPLFSQLAFAALDENTFVAKLPDAIHYQKFMDAARLSMYEIAFSIETDEDFQKFVESWYWVVNRVNELAEEGKYPLNLVQEARFIRNGPATLSPARGFNFTAYIEILTGNDVQGGRSFFGEVAEAWERINPHARTHWSKFSRFIPNMAERLRRQYGSALEEFKSIRRELNVDPDRIFFNSFLDQLF